MLEIELTKVELNNLILNSKPYFDDYIYLVGDKIYKFDPRFIISYKSYYLYNSLFSSNRPETMSTNIKKNQIRRINCKQKHIKQTNLPLGILTYQKNPIGVIYKAYENYKNFNELHHETSNVILNNLRLAITKNNELIRHRIFNTDLAFRNILYDGENVELIDLDGRFIKSFATINDIYYIFFDDMFDMLRAKILTQYDEEELKHIKLRLYTLLKMPKRLIDMNYPFRVIDKIETLKLLK